MRGGFSFCGTDIADLGLEYAPELKDTNVYRPATTNVHEETFDGHDGSYIYGASRDAKEFILRVFFEEKVIDRGLMTHVFNLFRVGKSGKLVFQRRPWCYYYATVTNIDDSELRNYMNGLITITLKAAYPFSRCDGSYLTHSNGYNDIRDSMYNERTDKHHNMLMTNTAMFDRKEMVPPVSFSFGTSGSPVSATQSLILANPGTEPAKVGIIAAGNAGMGVVIRNETTGQECKLVAMSEEKTTNANKHVLIDGLNGKTTLVNENDNSSEYCFLYHDHGFIELAPAYPALRDIFIDYDASSITTPNNLLGVDNYKGHFVFIDNQWHEIASNDNHTITLNSGDILSGSGQEQTTIMRMNKITIDPVGSMYLSKLSFIYEPTFA